MLIKCSLTLSLETSVVRWGSLGRGAVAATAHNTNTVEVSLADDRNMIASRTTVTTLISGLRPSKRAICRLCTGEDCKLFQKIATIPLNRYAEKNARLSAEMIY